MAAGSEGEGPAPVSPGQKPAGDSPQPHPRDLEACPRCGESIGQLVWGQTNCPRCGLHFECC